MRLNYFFPIFKDDDIKKYLNCFKLSNFFKSYENYNFIFVCESDDKNNLTTLKSELKKNKENVLITLNKPFTYNDAFYNALNYFNGDIVLLGDSKINRIDLIFEKCMQKYTDNVKVIHIVKKQTKIKGFFLNFLNKIYNFFIKIFTNKTDRLNIISLGLIDKDIIDIIKTLPNKCCFLKNTKQLLGFETRTIYIPKNTKTVKPNYKKFTGALISSLIGGGLTLMFVLLIILLNCFIKTDISVYNIILVFFIILNLCVCITTLPKHFFDIRNYENRKETFEVKQIK